MTYNNVFSGTLNLAQSINNKLDLTLYLTDIFMIIIICALNGAEICSEM